MKIWIDTINLTAIDQASRCGILQGITIPDPLIFDALTIPVANRDLVAFANDWRAGKAVQESVLFKN